MASWWQFLIDGVKCGHLSRFHNLWWLLSIDWVQHGTLSNPLLLLMFKILTPKYLTAPGPLLCDDRQEREPASYGCSQGGLTRPGGPERQVGEPASYGCPQGVQDQRVTSGTRYFISKIFNACIWTMYTFSLNCGLYLVLFECLLRLGIYLGSYTRQMWTRRSCWSMPNKLHSSLQAGYPCTEPRGSTLNHAVACWTTL